MPKGNPNPSPATRFKPGQSANPGGKTSEQRIAEIRNAQKATEIRTLFLEALQIMMLGSDVSDSVLKLEMATLRLKQLSPETLRLLKDVEDRGLGSPKASVDHTNSDGSLAREPVRDAIADLLHAIHACKPEDPAV